jgi:predicted metal-dependent phosphoesterase TrpH
MYLKFDIHIHSSEDKYDRLPFTPYDIIRKAVAKNIRVLSFTHHRELFWDKKVITFAKKNNILLIPGIEIDVAHKHIVVLNPPRGIEKVKHLKDLAGFKSPSSFWLAPHPFFPRKSCLQNKFFRYSYIFDAIEYSSFYTQKINFNYKACQIAQEFKLPLIATSDCHSFMQFGRTYSRINSKLNKQQFIKDLKNQKIYLHTQPLTWSEIIKVYIKGFYNNFNSQNK